MSLEFDATDSDLTLFLDEAAEQLRTLSDGLLQMERDGGDAPVVQAVFRAAHTLKGSSATIGHHRMARLTHVMESVLDSIRHGTLAPRSDVIDSLLVCVDALNILNEEVMTREEAEIDIDDVAQRLQKVANRAEATGRSAAERPALSDTEQASLSRALSDHGGRDLEVVVTIDPGSEWPAVRAYQALMELAPLGRVFRSWPSAEELQSGTGGHTLRVRLVSDREPQALHDAVKSVSDITAVTVTEPGAAAPADAPPTLASSGRPAEPAPTEPASDARTGSKADHLGGAGRAQVAARMVKVDIARLDDMMNLVGELVIDRGRLLQVLREMGDRYGAEPALEHLSELSQHLSRISDDLQQQVMLSRLLPVESVFNRFPRMVRDLARKCGKSVRFLMEGEQTGLDRSVIDEIGDPLLHILRNAIDHGIEPPDERERAGKPAEGTLLLSARHEESYIVIEVTDDGRGINPARLRELVARKGLMSAENAARLSDEEAINLIFMPGFTTTEQVTDVSGRGVGMDIVRTNIEKINGSVKVSTQLGEGTIFTIRLPLTLAIIRALLVRVGEGTFTIPLASVQETLRIRTDTIHTVQGREVVLVRGQALTLVRLADIFSRGDEQRERADGHWCYVVAVRTGRTELGLIVDSLIGEQEVVIKSMDGMLADTDGLAGATILGDGRVSMIVDVPKVVERLAVEASRTRTGDRAPRHTKPTPGARAASTARSAHARGRQHERSTDAFTHPDGAVAGPGDERGWQRLPWPHRDV